jgi:hypothetical protein
VSRSSRGIGVTVGQVYEKERGSCVSRSGRGIGVRVRQVYEKDS